MKYEFVIPTKISLQGSIITIKYDEGLSDQDLAGLWSTNKNEITLNPAQCLAVQFETFCHELCEAINTKFVNEPANGMEVDHRIVDAYGRGFFNFLIENLHNLLIEHKENRETKPPVEFPDDFKIEGQYRLEEKHDDQPRRAQGDDGAIDNDHP